MCAFIRCWRCLWFIEIIEMRCIKLEFGIKVRTTAIALCALCAVCAVCVVCDVFIVFN